MRRSSSLTSRPPRADDIVLAPPSEALVERLERILVPLLEREIERVERRRSLRKVDPRG